MALIYSLLSFLTKFIKQLISQKESHTMLNENQPTEQEIKALINKMIEINKKYERNLNDSILNINKEILDELKSVSENEKAILTDKINKLKQELNSSYLEISTSINNVINDTKYHIEIKNNNFSNIISYLFTIGKIYSEVTLEYDRALSCYEMAIKICDIDNSENKELVKGDIYNYMGLLHSKTGKDRDEVICYKYGIKIIKEKIQQLNTINHKEYNKILMFLYSNLGNVYLRKGNYKESIKLSEQVINLSKDPANESSDIFYYLLLLLFKLTIFDFTKIEKHKMLTEIFDNKYVSVAHGFFYMKKFIKSGKDGDFKDALRNIFSNKDNHKKNIYQYYDTYIAIAQLQLINNKVPDNIAISLNTCKKLYDKVTSLGNDYTDCTDVHATFINVINTVKLERKYNYYSNLIILLFKISCLLKLPIHKYELTKYTHTRTFDIIYGKNKASNLRINDAREMNDANEGKLLYEFLKAKKHNNPNEQAFISAFTQNSGDAMQMWQTTYGDNCKGISYTFSPTTSDFVSSSMGKNNIINEDDNYALKLLLSYFRVAYYNKDNETFSVYDYDDETKNTIRNANTSYAITQLFNELKMEIRNCTGDIPFELQSLFSFISYLVKDIGWYYENEVRLIHISTDPNDPKIKTYEGGKHALYYDTERPIYPHKVTLGPKFQYERQALGYYQNVFDNDIDVTISEFPYNFPPQ